MLMMHNGKYLAEIAHNVSSRKRSAILERAVCSSPLLPPEALASSCPIARCGHVQVIVSPFVPGCEAASLVLARCSRLGQANKLCG